MLNIVAKFSLMAGVSLIAPGVARATDIPTFDVEIACQSYAKHTGTDLSTVKAFCLQKNKEAKERLSTVWSKIGADRQDQCITLSKDQPFPYNALLMCVGIHRHI